MNAVSKKEAAALELVPAANAASAPTPGPLPTSLAANFMLTLQERGAGLEQIEKMMDLLERNERHEAEKAYNEALAAFKAKNIRIVKRKLVDFPARAAEPAISTPSWTTLCRPWAPSFPIMASPGRGRRTRPAATSPWSARCGIAWAMPSQSN